MQDRNVLVLGTPGLVTAIIPNAKQTIQFR